MIPEPASAAITARIMAVMTAFQVRSRKRSNSRRARSTGAAASAGARQRREPVEVRDHAIDDRLRFLAQRSLRAFDVTAVSQLARFGDATAIRVETRGRIRKQFLLLVGRDEAPQLFELFADLGSAG